MSDPTDIRVYADGGEEQITPAQAEALIAELDKSAPGWAGAKFARGADGNWTVEIVESASAPA